MYKLIKIGTKEFIIYDYLTIYRETTITGYRYIENNIKHLQTYQIINKKKLKNFVTFFGQFNKNFKFFF